jgi:hypothetical protein
MKIIDHGIFILEINGGVATMNFNTNNSKYPQELIDSSFDRERRNLLKIIAYEWAPEITEINPSKKCISFKWYDNTCEDMIPEYWKEQLEGIAQDLHFEHLYKPNFYPKCFYTDNQGYLHAYIFYSTSTYEEQPINIDFYKPILNDDRLELVNKLATDGKLDMKILIEQAFNNYILWPDNALSDIYKKVYL